jgi:hypothetical protein
MSKPPIFVKVILFNAHTFFDKRANARVSRDRRRRFDEQPVAPKKITPNKNLAGAVAVQMLVGWPFDADSALTYHALPHKASPAFT